ncbi:MAG: HNH endonuclease [Dysgonamonadaceae bacterium]|jgi:hypothetical protein|nr:HNH endonuclease [Dysgonamonadaceae bacterium]
MAEIQSYEEYWKLTLEYTDFNDDKFLTTLQMVVDKVDFLNQSGSYEYNKDDYQKLQTEILEKVPKTSANIENQLASTRKAINQCVKLGFVNSFLNSYHHLTKAFLQAKTNRKRKTLLSRIVYDNSSFNRSITTESNLHQLNFLINTLVENGKLSKTDIIALMIVDIEQVAKGYLTRRELDYYVNDAISNKFIERKYNQVGYLNNILNKLDEICFVNDELYFTEDTKRIFGEEIEVVTKKRNPYLYLLYKNQLKEESFSIYHAEKCMVEKLDYPVLIASHIKPFIDCDEDIEASDVNNGILLSRNFDSLFDLGYITFANDGKVIVSEQVSQELTKHISKYQLNSHFINPTRLKYMEYHRKNVFEHKAKIYQNA